MENPILSQCPEGSVTYDYRMYDRIWQRVSPDLDPYPDVRAANAAGAQNAAATPPVSAPAPAAPAPKLETPAVPVAVDTPAPAAPVQSGAAAAAGGKQCAAQEMCTAYYLITGQCYTPTITVEQMRWDNLAAALRSCYHQEACNGFNYARAAEGTTDLCLQKLFTRLSQQAYQRADEVMCALGQVSC